MLVYAPPVVDDIPDQGISAGDSFVTIALDEYVTDADDGDAAIAWTVAGASDLQVSIVDRVATVTCPAGGWSGSETITFTATDPRGAWDSDPATFAVSDFSAPASRLVITEVNLSTWTSEVQITDVSGGSLVQVYYNSGTNRRGPFSLWDNSFGGAWASVAFRNIVAKIDSLDAGSFAMPTPAGRWSC